MLLNWRGTFPASFPLSNYRCKADLPAQAERSGNRIAGQSEAIERGFSGTGRQERRRFELSSLQDASSYCGGSIITASSR